MRLIIVADSKIFVMGNNRDNAYDSHFGGFLDEEALIGKARFIYFSRDHETGKIRWNLIGIKVDTN